MYPITLDGNSIEEKREEIKAYFRNTFSLFEKVFEVLENDSVFYKQSELTRHPMIFYFGHTATFYINKLIYMQVINERINPDFESIFAVGVDEMDWDDLESSNYRWPKVQEVREYRKRVKELVEKLIDSLEFSLPIQEDSPMWIILMGIEHEKIHIETSLVLHRQMPLQYIKESETFVLCPKSESAPKNEMVKINARKIKLGKDKTHHLYGWDNEYGAYEEELDTFETSKYLVSNAEFMEFVEDAGYEKQDFWDEEGLTYLKNTKAKHPAFWIDANGVFKYRALTREIEMPLDWPVEVNALEAEAFCRYKSKKEGILYTLPSESEYRAIYEQAGLEDVPSFDEKSANLNFAHYCSSMPVNSFEFNGIYDVVGNVWQWSRTPIRGFEGFEVHKAYDDFSTPTFDEKHSLILGSSWASSGNIITKHSRYAFRKHFYQNAGFRYVVSKKENKEMVDIYESDELVSQYCEFQYGDTHFGVENFAIACAKVAQKYTEKKTKALDLGCATGRATFELAKTFESVEGIDFSARFVQAGVKLKNDGYLAFTTREEGDLVSKKKVSIEELGFEKLRDKVSFWQGDACNMKPNFTSYDFIMATNLIDRLYEPKLFLESVHERLNSNGVLMITSPYTWQESSTKKELWLGGYVDENGKEIETLETLKTVLGKEFELVHTQDLEFVIKETRRKYQHTISQVSVWKKR
jgi:5-histidylcysteine sulfoxide synthase/putative 4-mercaptohistidine N1-methyltranferase